MKKLMCLKMSVVLGVVLVVACQSFASTIAQYSFETDNGSPVHFDQFTTATSVIDDSVGGYNGSVHMPTDGGYALRYRYGYDDTTEHHTYALYSYAQNYGSTDRWVDLGEGTFDSLGSFSVGVWVNLLNVYNYKYRDEKVWHFDDEQANGVATFDVHLGTHAATGSVPDKVIFRHIDSNGTEYSVSVDWTAGTGGWAYVLAEYDLGNKQLTITKTDLGGSPVSASASDTSGESLGDGAGAQWHYYLMGGQSLNGLHFYGAIDEVTITPEPATIGLMLLGLVGLIRRK